MLKMMLYVSTLSGVLLMGAALRSATGEAGQDAVAPATPAVTPMKVTPESLAQAKKMYGYDCEMCHGAKGDGKGDFAVQSKLAMKDWTSPDALKGMSDSELYTIILKGKGTMTGEEGRTTPQVMWAMVAMARSDAKP